MDADQIKEHVEKLLDDATRRGLDGHRNQLDERRIMLWLRYLEVEYQRPVGSV